MTFVEFEIAYWQQFSYIEEEIVEMRKYVEFEKINLPTRSAFFQKLILEIGSEVDNVLGEICALNKSRQTISDYAPVILAKYPQIINQKVKIRNSLLTLQPFDGWNIQQPSKSLKFWDRYNLIKHKRTVHFTKSNLENTLDAFAALYILELYYFNDLYCSDESCAQNLPSGESEILELEGWKHHYRDAVISKVADDVVID